MLDQIIENIKSFYYESNQKEVVYSIAKKPDAYKSINSSSIIIKNDPIKK